MQQGFLISSINLRGLPFPIVGSSLHGVFRRLQAVFPQRNLVLRLKHRLAPRAAQNLRQDFLAVRSVQHRKIAFIAHRRRIFAQNSHAQRMEGGNGQPARLLLAQAVGNALLHFVGGFVGERDGGNVVRLIAAARNHVDDFFDNHTRFAAARPRKDKQRPAQIFNRLLLRWIQFHNLFRVLTMCRLL